MGFSQRGRADINVTPLIDVLLVLLVIFLIIIPKVVRTEQIDVPPDVPGVEPLPAVVLTVKADLTVVVTDEDQQTVLAPGEVSSALRAHLRDKPHVVFVEFDDGVLWNQVVGTIDTIRGVAPTTQVALKVKD